jgi:hypothetical protein
MQMSARLSAFFSIIFAAVCLWFAIDTFSSLAGITDPVEVTGASDLAWFWSFLAAVGVVLAWVSWKVAQAQTQDDEA